MADKRFEIEELVGNDERGKFIHRTVKVPDGKWVVTVVAGSTGEQSDEEYGADDQIISEGWVEEERWFYVTVGSEPVSEHLVERLGTGTRYHQGGKSWRYSSRRLLVGDAPFGAVFLTEANGIRSSHHLFVSARQIHKGELGRGPQFDRPLFAREARDADELAWKNEGQPEDARYPRRALRRHHACWARLEDVTALIDTTPMDLVQRFYPFADADGRGLPVLFAASREEIHGKIIPPNAVERFTERELPRLFDRNPNTIWVRAGFAKTVLCLHHLGYKPDAVSKIS